jgi:hypothetical protein
MTTYNYKPGLGNAASYEVSGIPYVTGGLNPAGGEIALSFPQVTRWVVVSNTDATAANTVKIGFSSNGVGGENYYLLSGSQTTPRLEVKVTELYLNGASTNVSVMAGLTFISKEDINNIAISPSGSNWSGSLNSNVG